MAYRALIAVLLPSRGRPEMLAAAIGSLLGRATHSKRVAVLVAADKDDAPTQEVARHLGAGCLVFPHLGYSLLHAYYQGLAATPPACDAEWLLVWNDDALMLTPGWDVVLDQQPAWVMVADLHSHHAPLCCFPAVRNGAVDAIGRFCSDNPHVDSFWQEVGRLSESIFAVPIEVRHDQQPGPHQGNEHGFNDPEHRTELIRYAELIRSRKGSCHA